MPTAAPPTAGDQSPTGSDSDEYEYEEVEVEEEIEVEEEVSDDGEDENEQVSDDEEEIEEIEEQKVEKQKEKENRKETIITDDEKASQCDGGMMSTDTRNPFNESGKGTDDEKASQCDGGILSANTCNPLNESKEEVSGGESVINLNVPKEIPHPAEQTTQMCAKDVNDALQKESRSEVALIRPRRLSPAVETNEGNKRPALICDFFAKGWCIKGNSCRFRHMKEPTDVGEQQNESSVPAYQKGEPQDDKGLATSAAAPTIDGSAETIELQKSTEGLRPKVNPESQKENLVTISSYDTGKEGLQENQYLDKDKPPVNADSSLHETSSNPFMGSDIHRNSWVASYTTSIEERGGRGYQYGFHNHKMPTTNYSLNYSSSSFQPTTRMSPSNHSSVWPSTFLSSSFPGSESERLYRTNEVPLLSAGFASKFSTYNWEPSKPFRSAFLLSQGISTPDIQYDPLRDSIEPIKIGDKVSKFSSSSRPPSISSTHSPKNINPPQKETFGTDYGSSHVNGDDNDYAMDVDSNDCELYTSQKGESTKSDGKGKKHLTSAHVGDVIQASEIGANHYSLQQNDVPITEVKVRDESSHYHKQLDFDPEGDMHRESKALRHFRAALIEYVKELVKPTWRDGKLSKDAHKLIVKKAVDKVLSTLPPEHIPSIQESVDMYLSSSKPKLVKLVEGYIEKYGKL